MFGAPAAADKAQLIVVMSGDYRSKKEASYVLVPAVGRKVYDLGGNLEKGELALHSTIFIAELRFLVAPTFKLVGNSMILGCLEVQQIAP